jgi:circadian clock protein KaiB
MNLKRRTSKGRRRRKPPERRVNNLMDFERLLQTTSGRMRYLLRLYVTGTTPRSTAAVANIRALCEEHLHNRYDLVVIDIYQQPREAMMEQIIAVPTLVKTAPQPIRRLIGNLEDREKVLIGLDLLARPVSGKNQSRSS